MEDQKPLFTDLTLEESASVSGGNVVDFNLMTYFTILGAGLLYGNPGLTPEEVQFAWENSFVFEQPRRSARRRRGFLWW